MSFFDAYPAKKNLPARRYAQFIDVYEKQVAAAQAQIKAIEEMEQPYNLVVDALEEVKLPNDQSVSIYASTVGIKIAAVTTDRVATFDPVIAAIGSRLAHAKLHRNGMPSSSDGGHDRYLRRTWRGTVQKPSNVYLAIEVPREGLRDITFECYERTYIDYQYKLVPQTSLAGVMIGVAA